MAFGLGRGIGLLIASFIYTLIEQRSLFLIISIFNLIAAVIFSLYFLGTRQRHSKENKDSVISIEDGKYLLDDRFISSFIHRRYEQQN